MYSHEPYTVHVIRLSENIDRRIHNGCTNDKFLSPKIGVSCWIRTSARDPTLIVRVKNRTPLYLRHNCLVDRRGNDPRSSHCKCDV